MTPTEALASEIRAEMARRRLGPAELAAALDVHRVTASSIYNGHAPIDMERLSGIAAWLDLSPADLLARAESPLEPAGDAA